MDTSKLSKQQKDRKKTIIIGGIILGFILCIIHALLSKSAVNDELNANEYGAALENKLEEIIETALGENSEVKAMITFEEETNITESKQEISVFSLEDSKANNEAKTKRIKGVMIVSRSICSKSDFETIQRAVSTALGIEINQIYIIGGKSGNEEYP